jgi:hypothetical protein
VRRGPVRGATRSEDHPSIGITVVGRDGRCGALELNLPQALRAAAGRFPSMQPLDFRGVDTH